jgi:hypothetical protein
MPTYEIQTPDGATYEIEADDERQLQSTIASLSGAPSAEGNAPPERSLWDETKRGLGLTGRTVVQGLTDLTNLPADLSTHLLNLGNRWFGGKPYKVTLDDGTTEWRDPRQQQLSTLSEGRDAMLNDLGVPEPQTSGERMVNAMGRASLGAGSVASAAARMPGALARTMAQRPALQMASGATSGGSAELAREHGFGPAGQTAAALVGGILPAVVSPRVQSTLQMIREAGSTGAEASATPGQAGAQAEMSATPELRMRGGGSTFGAVGDDPSAGLEVPSQRIADRARELGFRMTPGQATGSRSLQQLEAKLESQPMTSGPFNTIKAHNARLVARAAAESIGENSSTLDDAVLSRAENRIGRVFEDAADDVTRQIDAGDFVRTYATIKDEVHGLVKGFDKHPLVEDVTNLAVSGNATGKQLQSLTSKLGKAAYKEMSTPSGDRDLGGALYRLKDYVDDLLTQGMSPDRAARFGQARAQYRNLMLLLSRGGVVNPATGNVSGRSLASVLQSKDRRGYTYGENTSPMYDAARFSQAFAPIVGDSGTATRMPLQGVTDMVARIPMNLAARAYTSSPGISLATRAQSATNAVTNYPTNIAGPFAPGDIPYGAAVGPLTLDEKRKRLALALMNEDDDE